MLRAALFLATVFAIPASHSHPVPEIWMSGQRLVDLFDPAIAPKTLFSADGTFVAHLPAGGWANDPERWQHIRAIDAENGRAYIKAVYDGTKGTRWCLRGNERLNDATFFDDVIRELRALPRAQLQGRSAFELISEIWSKKLPCPSDQRIRHPD